LLGELRGNEVLARILSKEIETLECVSSEKVSVLNLLDEDDSGMENIKFYVGLLKANIDGFRVK
jgi:hypothetical protein